MAPTCLSPRQKSHFDLPPHVYPLSSNPSSYPRTYVFDGLALGRVVKRFVQIVLVNDQLFVGAAGFFKEPLGSREGVHGIRSSMQQQQRTAKRFHSYLGREMKKSRIMRAKWLLEILLSL